MKNIQQFKKINDYHKFANIKAPEHPLISLIDYSTINYPDDIEALKWKQEYYTIGLKRNIKYKFFYGQQEYDFDEGIMTFISNNQIMNLCSNPNITLKPSGYLLLFHPDFLWKTNLGKKISEYQFFSYNVNEALFLSEKEEQMMIDILKKIEKEYQSNIDKFSQNIIVSQLELLLNYAERFYERQFITRKITNHQILGKLETLLKTLFNQENLIKNGLPTVQLISENLNLTPNYLSSLLKTHTGQSTQQHIHNKLIEIAKEQLASTAISISEIAYNLGFERPASFTKLFKSKTEMSPLTFRKTYN